MYILAEKLGDVFKWYDSKDDAIVENLISFFVYNCANMYSITANIGIDDLVTLLNPKNKTFGYILVAYCDGNMEAAINKSTPIPPISIYAIPFNDDAMKILSKYGLNSKKSYEIYDFDMYYYNNGQYKASAVNFWDTRYDTMTIVFTLFSLQGEYLREMLDICNSVGGYTITCAGTIENSISEEIRNLVQSSSNAQQCIKDLLSGKLGVFLIEDSW